MFSVPDATDWCDSSMEDRYDKWKSYLSQKFQETVIRCERTGVGCPMNVTY